MSKAADYSPIGIRDPADTLIAFGYQQVRFLGSVSVVQNAGQTQVTIIGPTSISLPDNYSYIFEDFLNGITSITAGLQSSTSGAGASNTAQLTPTSSKNPGIVRSSTGGTATGRAAIHNSFTSYFLNGAKIFYKSVVSVDVLSTGVDRYSVRYGMMDNVGGAEPIRGIYFRYTDTENSGNFVCVCRSSSIETIINTSISPTLQTTFRSLSWLYDPSIGVEFFIDGVSQGIITTNIPTGTGNELGVVSSYIVKSIGTGARRSNCDLLYLSYEIIGASR